ncbi:MAG: LPS assembly protein LptD [Caldimonas sp.]
MPSVPAASAASVASPAPAAGSAVPGVTEGGIVLRRAETLQAPARGEAARRLPIILRARDVRGRPDLDASAEGDVEFRRGGMVIHADKLTYDQAEDLARATGHVVVTRDGNVFSGPELQLKVERFEGFFRTPTYRFARTGAGGKAKLIEFIDDQRASATDATYSSCTIEDGDGEPVWILKARELHIDNETNEGIARGAVLRFYGVPILASPVLSFPLNEERKSGFLPPSFGIDSRSGLQAAIPYYWNIAPNRDATFTLQESVRRGPSVDSEFRYLEPSFFGSVNGKIMPRDAVAERSRYSLRADHEGSLPYNGYVQLKAMRVSDDDYWKDFPGEVKSLTPRLLQTDLLLTRPFGDWSTYARALRWQVLQTVDPTTRIDSPYERMPQVGARYAGPWRGGLDVGFETEFNRFANPDDTYLAQRQTGLRTHAIGSIARPFVSPGWSLTPRLSFNAASYSLDLPLSDGRRNASRVIPTVSVDSAWTLERETSFFGRAVRQTLEPRLFYVNTPFRRQDDLPNFDAAPKDFNFDSLFTENSFAGVDRVSDSNQLTAGVVSRVLDPDTGAEALRVGMAQRYRFRDQRITPDNVPLTQRFSDVLVFGSTSLVPRWIFDTAVQFNPDSHRIERSLASVRYSPGPYRTVGLTYRLARDLSEQVELGWQWPVYGPGRGADGSERKAGGNGCNGTLYSVGHVNYSTRDSRLTDSIAGFEYDAGCWIGRIVVERLSTGRSEATTRLLLQLELVGLSRLGSNPLRVLKDNVPGYQLLREERTTTSPFTPYD